MEAGLFWITFESNWFQIITVGCWYQFCISLIVSWSSWTGTDLELWRMQLCHGYWWFIVVWRRYHSFVTRDQWVKFGAHRVAGFCVSVCKAHLIVEWTHILEISVFSVDWAACLPWDAETRWWVVSFNHFITNYNCFINNYKSIDFTLIFNHTIVA